MDNMDLKQGGVKADVGKIRMDLLPMDALMAAAAVFTYGAEKYDDWNWAKGMRLGRLVAAMQRHLAALMCGEDFDEESTYPHSWHLLCTALMLVSLEARGTLEDDRDMTALSDGFGETDALEAIHTVRDIHASVAAMIESGMFDAEFQGGDEPAAASPSDYASLTKENAAAVMSFMLGDAGDPSWVETDDLRGMSADSEGPADQGKDPAPDEAEKVADDFADDFAAFLSKVFDTDVSVRVVDK